MATYYMPGPDESFLSKIATWIKTGKRFRPLFPRAVQFQTMSACNATCVFCPHGTCPSDIPHGRMDDALIKKIIAECAQHMRSGRISPYLTNEPLLDKRMPELLKSIKKSCWPMVKTKINSNAGLLTRETGEKLIDAGLDQLWISVNGYSPETYRQSMGLDFQTTMDNIDTFLALKKKKGVKRPKVSITTLATSIVNPELEGAKRYWAERDVTFKIHRVDNRCSETDIEGLRGGSVKTQVRRNCDLFLKQAYIVENGDMIICCHDWRQSVKVGNIANSSIKEVWNSDRFKKLIYEYYEEKFDNIEICRNCS